MSRVVIATRGVSSVAQAAIVPPRVVVPPVAVLAVVFVMAVADALLAGKIELLRVCATASRNSAIIDRNAAIIDLIVSQAIQIHPAGALGDFIRLHALQPRDLVCQFVAGDSLFCPAAKDLAQAIAEGRAAGHRGPVL
jgi:hypothetical protein